MSECVVRMELPKNCFECPFSIIDDTADGAWCNALANQVYGYDDRDEDCPIICQLPEGHGRLVDAELVKENLKPVDSISHYEPEWTWGELHEINCVAIDNAPTIVPAEAERSKHEAD